MESKTYLTFNDELQVMTDYINVTEVSNRLGISDEQKTQMANYKQEFNAEMLLYTNPAARTSVLTKQIAEMYKMIHKWVNAFRQAIKHGKADVITESDYASLFIHKDKVRSKHTVPTTAPTLELEHIEHLNTRISAHHHSSFSKGTKPRLPQGIDIIDWQWAIMDSQTPSADTHYTNHRTTHSATLKMEFDESDTGKFCHLVARYGIISGETGSDSPLFAFAIT